MLLLLQHAAQPHLRHGHAPKVFSASSRHSACYFVVKLPCALAPGLPVLQPAGDVREYYLPLSKEEVSWMAKMLLVVARTKLGWANSAQSTTACMALVIYAHSN